MDRALQKITPGTRLAAELRADTWNAFIDAANDYRGRLGGATGAELLQPAPADRVVVQVKNVSGGGLPRFSIVGLDDILFTPTQNLAGFQDQFAFKVTAPDTVTHSGRYAVTLSTVASNAFTGAMVTGPCPVQVDIQSTNDRTAVVVHHDTSKMKSAATGSARAGGYPILYAPASTGVQWCIVLLGAGGGSSSERGRPVRVLKDGGADGDATTTASWTYSLYEESDAGLATAVATGRSPKISPARIVPGPVTYAPSGSIGWAYTDSSGALQLLTIMETHGKGTCA
jgi:hypothetical protein